MLIAVPATLGAREMGMTNPTLDTVRRQFPAAVLVQELRNGLLHVTGRSLPRLTMAAEKGRRNQSTGRCR